MNLPRSIDDLRGRRAARWIRESTRGQADRNGPDVQREQQDRAIERYGLVDSGLVWNVQHSGRTVASTDQWSAMLAAAGRQYDVLVVGYVSRFARDLRTAVNARHDLHLAGAALLFCDERLLSSDEDGWETWARETVEAEAYSRRLGRRVGEGLAAKFRRLGDQAGLAPWGFVRTGDAMALAPDPASIGEVVRAFERYATGTVTMETIADETGAGIEQVRKALRNPLYNGWSRRHRGAREELAPAAWRADPPVSDALWERVQEQRARRLRGGPRVGHWSRGIDPLGGLLYCRCGARIRTNGTAGNPARRQRIHPGACELWGDAQTVYGDVHEVPIGNQIMSVRLTATSLERVVRAANLPAPSLPTLNSARQAERRRSLALDHAAGRVDDETYIARSRALREPVSAAPNPDQTLTAERIVAYLRDLPGLWKGRSEEARAELAHAVYDRITVTRDAFVGVRLTPAAYAHHLEVMLPVTVKASPAGIEAGHTVRIPIEGRRESLRLVRTA